MFEASLNKFRIPHLKFIQTLIVGRMSAVDVVQKLQEFKLAFSPEDIAAVYKELAKQNPTYFAQNSKEEADLDWVRELELLDLWGYLFSKPIDMPITGIHGALKILDDQHLRKLILPMSMSGMSTEDIELTCTGRFDISYEPADFEKFIHYFANFKGWSNTDKELFINAQGDKELKGNYQLAMQGDKNYLLWKLGTAPTKSFDEMLREMFRDSFYHFKEKQKLEPEDAQRWGALAVKISDRLDKIEQDMAEKKNVFDEVRFKLAPDPMDTEGEVVTAESLGVEVPDQNNAQLPDLDALLQKDPI